MRKLNAATRSSGRVAKPSRALKPYGRIFKTPIGLISYRGYFYFYVQEPSNFVPSGYKVVEESEGVFVVVAE